MRGPRGSIEIASFFKNKPRHPQQHKLAREPASLRGSRVEFQEMGDRFGTLFDCFIRLANPSLIKENQETH